MENVQFTKNEKGHGSFFIEAAGKKIAEMEVHQGTDHLTVYHTEVQPEAEGQGLAKQLLTTMVAYAREHALKVIPLCLYVLGQFKHHPEEYRDVWMNPE
jgi:predicted GNAT family acetyltransferase